MSYRTRLAFAFALLFLVLTVLWALSVQASNRSGGFWAIRNYAVYYTGFLAIGFMSSAVILAARPIQFENALGGLDKFYKLHKWFGIAGASLGVAHWLIEILPRSFVRWGWLAPHVRRPRPPIDPSASFDLFRDLREPAVSVAEPALYVLLALVLLALWKRFPYRLFLRTHRLLSVVFIVLVFHAVILMGRAYWQAPLGPVIGVLMAAASLAALASLFRRIGKDRRATGTIADVNYHGDSGVLELTIALATAWPGHRAGQFAYVDFGDGEPPHPFTIASAWHHDGRLHFGIKELGDYTQVLPERLFPGQSVTIEGPYGRFDFDHGRRQLWIAGGIGIMPFVAGLERYAEQEERPQIDLIYSTRHKDEGLLKRLAKLAGRTGARLHLLVTPPDPQLTIQSLEDMVPDWRGAEVWFCGPADFCESIRAAMLARGLPASRFHQELFVLR